MAGTISEPTTFKGVTVKVSPLQMVAVWFAITGFGFTVTVTVKVAPIQFEVVVGVTV